ncbi:MAG TPA: NUDIX domain-containing protein [Anaerolineaceae bacterium]|nr:NUDIX domain-containing protein [Anaerolineaceae bacterium]
MGKNEQGVTRDRYMLIPRALVFASREDKVLLIKGAPTKRLWANHYNGVGGHIEKGEDIQEGAKREFREETGLSLIEPWLCGVISVDTGEDVGIGIFVFRGTCSPDRTVQSDEGTLEWIEIDHVQDYHLVEDLYQLIPRVFAVQPGQPPFFGQYRYNTQDQLEIHFS